MKSNTESKIYCELHDMVSGFRAPDLIQSCIDDGIIGYIHE